MNNFFNVDNLMSLSKTKKTISKEDYQIFCKEYIFNAIQGETFGNSFCKRFEISDNMLSRIKDTSEAKFLINNLGYIK
jgi:hypothetical protein